MHRKQESYPDIIQLKARDLLVKNRTRLVNAVRGILKSTGLRVPPSGTSCFPSKATLIIPDELKPSLLPLLETISHLNKQIYSLDNTIETLARNRYPETDRLRQISGVGPITALQYVLTIGDPGRFARSREVAACLGLTPRRSLLVPCAQYPFGTSWPGQRPQTMGDSNVRTEREQWQETRVYSGGPKTCCPSTPAVGHGGYLPSSLCLWRRSRFRHVLMLHIFAFYRSKQ
jgi:hypothetical protein